ncbi:MAG TPA: hypothetical protein VJ123_10025 [Anaerolineales bacterium]|nr:hypothetical protein [Anaerolineales bacterium]
MSRSMLRNAILVLGLATALIHLYLNVFYDDFSVLFTLNGLGYLGLLAGIFLPIPFLAGRERLVKLALIAYAAVTILAWVAMGDRIPLGYIDKAIEVLLILALFASLRTPAASQA